jgi:hypothetical protein
MDPECSLTRSQKTAAGPYPDIHELASVSQGT